MPTRPRSWRRRTLWSMSSPEHRPRADNRSRARMSYDIAYYERIAGGLAQAAAASRVETNPEKALLAITECARTSVGDPTARERPGAVNPGDPDFVISGIFFVAPTRD